MAKLLAAGNIDQAANLAARAVAGGMAAGRTPADQSKPAAPARTSTPASGGGGTAAAAPLTERLAASIKQYEGWAPGSVSERNNNPGNLKFNHQPGATGQDEKGFAIFKDYDSGWNALLHRVNLGIKGGRDLNQFFATYAPAEDNNNPLDYSRTVGRWLGIAPNARLDTLH